MQKEILRYPRLDSIQMVERFVRDHDGEYKRKELWNHLPKKMMYQTFQVIIQYLLESRKISSDSQGKIGWIFYPNETSTWFVRKDLGR